jgi:signal transduction histidine kinase
LFDDLKIRNKLVVLVAVPMIVIVILAFLEARSRQNIAEDADEVSSLVVAAERNADVVNTLQSEAMYSTGYLASGRKEWKAQLTEARKATDAAIETARGSLTGSTARISSSIETTATMAVNTADSLSAVRTVVDQGYTWNQVVDTYETIETSFLRVNTAIAGSVSDSAVAGDLRTTNALSSLKQSIGTQGVLLVGASNAGSFDATSHEALQAAIVAEDNDKAIFDSLANPAAKTQQRNAVTGDEWTNLENNRKKLADSEPGAKVSLDPIVIERGVRGVLDRLHLVETDNLTALAETAAARSRSACLAANVFLGVALLSVLLIGAAAILLGRRITRPLKKLTEAADRLSNEQMPRLVESLRNPSQDDVDYRISYLEDIDVESGDEIGKLAEAFNNVQRVTGEVAAEQAATLRKGIGDMFVNLARRNQALLDRQIEFIDELERSEEDADQLENLYKLDHMATRMRRNAESLLVLAGAEPPRRRGRPAPFANVVRAALAEVEEFGRIEITALDEVFVASNAASDVAHLLSELMENATNFSPPDTRVEIVGHRTSGDGYVISITDQGIGMSADQFEDANRLLVKPPAVGLALSRSLGFTVVGRLALRHGIGVRMMSSSTGGVTALVTLPPALVTEGLGSTPKPVPMRRDQPIQAATGPTPSGSPSGLGSRTSKAPAAPAAAPAAAARDHRGLPPAATFAPPPGETAAPTPLRPAAAPPVPTPAAAPAAAGGRGGSEPLLFTPGGPRPSPTVATSGPTPSEPAATAANGLPTRRLVSSPAPGREPDPAPSRRNLRAPYDPPVVAEPVEEEAPLEAASFLEESGPPRLFGRRDETPAASAATPPTATAPGTTRLFGRDPDPVPAPPAAPPAAAEPAALVEDLPAASVPASPSPGTGAAEVLDTRPPRLPGRRRKDEAARPPVPAAPAASGLPIPASDPVGLPAAPTAPAAAVSAAPEAAPTTTSGLARRTPRGASAATRAIPGSDGERGVSATKRSPDEVRNLLSRYRAGQQRARTDVGSDEED